MRKETSSKARNDNTESRQTGGEKHVTDRNTTSMKSRKHGSAPVGNSAKEHDINVRIVYITIISRHSQYKK